MLTISKSDCGFSSSVGGRLFDVIMFDVDNKDSSLGMSCPPAAFVETTILQKVSNLLTPKGTESLIMSVHFSLLLQHIRIYFIKTIPD